MKKFDRILNASKNKSPIPLLFEIGYTPESIKEEIIEELSPYFKAKEALEQHAIDYLVADWINYLRLSIKFPKIQTDIKAVVETYNKAKEVDEVETAKVLATMMSYHIEAGNKFWSFLNLEVEKSSLEIEEFTHTSMKDISDIVEGISKSLFIEQVLINRIIRRKELRIENVLNSKLGNLIDELSNCSESSHLFKTTPDEIKLSDWRNIASHHSYSIKGEQIICEYGDKIKKTISLTRSELFDRVNQCMRTTEILNMAHKFFGFDNMDLVRKFINPSDKVARQEMKFLMFTSALASQGFEILKIDYTSEKLAVLDLIDLTDDEPRKRGIHSSQLLMALWDLTERELLEVNYYTKNKQFYLTSKVTKNICERIAEGEKDITYLAENVEFIIH
jgi:hypothetical protein